MPLSSFILSCHFEEFDYSQNVLLVLSLRLIQFISTFPFMVRGDECPALCSLKNECVVSLWNCKQEQKVLKTSAPRVNFMCSKQTFKISIKKVTKKSEIVLNRLK